MKSPRAATAIRLTPRAGVVIALAVALGLVAFFWPFVVAPGTFSSQYAPLLIFGVLLLLVLCVALRDRRGRHRLQGPGDARRTVRRQRGTAPAGRWDRRH
ncbi:fatty acid desaturase [Streptomyces zagrosensis]|uniref:Fatty acid desaturase n=1 Tax=Streptomyces zagrosensis TaxID=1042984 RepID=A0A7W9V246_9ACTN|nr:fatty acid desaturase [Streptomyces zagrosensis]